MYNIGDKIVCPLHGAGVIDSIEKKEVFGETKEYFVMRLPYKDIKIMIPICNVKEIGIRDIIDNVEVDNLLESFKQFDVEMDRNWNKRYRENLSKIKSGDVYEVARVVKGLMYRDKQKGLSSVERKMLSSAKQILFSELVLAKSSNQNEIEEMIEALI